VRIASKIGGLYDAALSLVYPQACAVCEVRSVEAHADLPACAECWSATRIFNEQTLMCSKCGLPLDSPAILSEEQKLGLRCHRCDMEEFTAARAVGVYEAALRASVLSLKRTPFVGTRLLNLLAETQKRAPLNEATRVIPVPLARDREQERGFNQAAILARQLASRNCLPLDEWSLTRTIHSSMHRAGMDTRARRESVDEAFRVIRPRLIETERILLVDDVLTTGATASACARALRAAGTKEVFVLTAARAI
jgi:ComF family protein